MTPRRSLALAFAATLLVAACAGPAVAPATSSSAPVEQSTGPQASQATAADSVATYRAYIEMNTDLLVTRTKAFAAAVEAGKVADAKALYAAAREPYERIEPVAETFGDLDPAIDARINDVPAGGTFTGFHRIEEALWSKNSTAGMTPIARKLVTDVTQLQTLVKTVDLDPATIANGAVGLLNEVSASKITGEEDRYSHTDLWDFEANVIGAQEAWTAVKPLVVSRAADLAATIDQGFSAVLDALQPFQRGDGYVLFTTLTPTDTQTLSQLIDALADPLSQVAAIVVTAQ
ncbi:MAG TPA: iron uptake system protein EfeO [Candidatus Limnocylindrales bacterium]|nr:iron uptake system protein EfeO [Candidatus Limnocylindrales bacterium]